MNEDYEIEEDGLNEEFEIEQVLRPKLFEDFEGQDKIVIILRFLLKQQLKGKMLWIMFCCTALQDLGKLL